jgi:hypothetical protein
MNPIHTYVSPSVGSHVHLAGISQLLSDLKYAEPWRSTMAFIRQYKPSDFDAAAQIVSYSTSLPIP